MVIDTHQAVGALPSVVTTKGKVYPVSSVEYFTGDDANKENKNSWSHENMHEKIGVSTDPAHPMICFADGNHRVSEMTHAGATVSKISPRVY